MTNEEIFNEITNHIKSMEKGTTFTFGELLKEYKVEDFQTKLDLTNKLKKALNSEIEIHPEDKDSFLGASFVFRYIKK